MNILTFVFILQVHIPVHCIIKLYIFRLLSSVYYFLINLDLEY